MQGLHFHPGEGEVGRAGGVKGGNLQGIAEGVVGGGYLPDSLNRATTQWIHGLNNVEYLQWHWVKIFQSIYGGLEALGRRDLPGSIGKHGNETGRN
jgi:hypothetical protein